MKSVLDYLKITAEKFPDKPALAINEKFITFNELVIKSQKLAATINKVNNKRGVAVFVNRGIDTVVLFMAAVYSGAFYIPIDPNMPIEKIKSILMDSEPSVILGDKDNQSLLDTLDYQSNFLTVEDIADEICDLPEPDEEMPLYMVYTSGSTGKPKGVLKNHKSMISFIETYVNTFDFSCDDVIGNQTPLFFDASAKDLYLMLKTGATLEIIPTGKFSMPTELIEYMNAKRVSFISWVPTAYSIVAQLRTFAFVKPNYLTKAFFVGEVMPTKTLNYWRKFLPDVQYVNLYGQSELSGVSCYYEVSGDFANDEKLPLGKPFSNCEIFIAEGSTVITEPHKVGEMYIISDALAVEYYNDREKTEASFVMTDFRNDGNPKRTLKSGDLAYYDDGLLFFASRSDSQIKHLGHRIELGEIETIAGAIDGVQRCCCLYNEKRRQITLFCELAGDIEVSDINIKSILKRKLSSYMVPGKIIIQETIPLNANGKINRTYLKELLK